MPFSKEELERFVERQPDVHLQIGTTKILDEQGNLLLTVELTPNQLVILGADDTVIQRSWRDIMKAIVEAKQKESRQAEEDFREEAWAMLGMLISWTHHSSEAMDRLFPYGRIDTEEQAIKLLEWMTDHFQPPQAAPERTQKLSVDRVQAFDKPEDFII